MNQSMSETAREAMVKWEKSLPRGCTINPDKAFHAGYEIALSTLPTLSDEREAFWKEFPNADARTDIAGEFLSERTHWLYEGWQARGQSRQGGGVDDPNGAELVERNRELLDILMSYSPVSSGGPDCIHGVAHRITDLFAARATLLQAGQTMGGGWRPLDEEALSVLKESYEVMHNCVYESEFKEQFDRLRAIIAKLEANTPTTGQTK